jgi:hypothetical protein
MQRGVLLITWLKNLIKKELLLAFMNYHTKEASQKDSSHLKARTSLFHHITGNVCVQCMKITSRKSGYAIISFVLMTMLLLMGCGAHSGISTSSFTVPAQPVVHIQVTNSPVPLNQPINIEYYTDMGIDGTISMDITKPPLLAIFWQSGPMPITGGLLNSISAPGFNDPGTYTVSASVNVTGGGTIYGSTTFQVGTGGSGTPSAPGFDYYLEVDPPVHEVFPGESALYEIIVLYNNPSYSGTPVQIQISNLGPGMQFHMLPGGQVEISTSPNTPPGEYHVDIMGEANGVVRHTSLTLIVQEEEPPPEEPPPEEPPPEEPPPEEPPPEEPPPEEPPPEEPEEEYRPSEPEEGPPEQPRYQEESQPFGLPTNVLYLIIGALFIIIILLIVLRRTTKPPPRAGSYCKNCGAPLEPGQTYCSSCGKRVGD